MEIADLKNENKKVLLKICNIQFKNYFWCYVEWCINLKHVWGFFVFDNKNPKFQKIMFLHTYKFTVRYVIRTSALRTRNIFFKLCNAAKLTFSSCANASQHRYLCEYPSEIFRGRNYECAFRKINVTNGIDLEIGINAIQKIKQTNFHKKTRILKIAIVVNSVES